MPRTTVYSVDVFVTFSMEMRDAAIYQGGPTKNNIKSVDPPGAKEVFVYEFLYQLGIGPEVHFIVPIHGTKQTIYVATKDAGLTLLEKLNAESVSIRVLLKMDFVARLLWLDDCTTNSTNCVQVDGKPIILDFRIRTLHEQFRYVKNDLLARFLSGNGQFNYVGLMHQATSPPMNSN
jgi:hypothetical protein